MLMLMFFSTIIKSNASSSGKKNGHKHTHQFPISQPWTTKKFVEKKIKKLFSAQLFKNNDDDDDYNG